MDRQTAWMLIFNFVTLTVILGTWPMIVVLVECMKFQKSLGTSVNIRSKE